jgi:Domain of unknown function (DUF5122) beta-propeller
MVARYNTNGTLDGSFGNGGSLDLNFFSSSNVGENIAVMADGRIVVSGMAENASGAQGYGVARLLP